MAYGIWPFPMTLSNVKGPANVSYIASLFNTIFCTVVQYLIRFQLT